MGSLHLLARLVGNALLCALLAIPATLLALPLWSWIEARWGIEAVGHSGPAEWCYVAAWLVLLAGASTLPWRTPPRRPD